MAKVFARNQTKDDGHNAEDAFKQLPLKLRWILGEEKGNDIAEHGNGTLAQ